MTATIETRNLVYGMPAPEYHGAEGLGSTSIKTLSDPDISMAEARHMMSTDEHKRVYDVGTLGHSLILEGSLDDLVARIDADSYRSNAAKEARDQAYNDGLIPINNAEVDTILTPVEAMRDAVMGHPVAGPLLTGHQAEVSLFWEQDGVPCKGRLDAYHPDRGMVVDLKLLRSARPSDVQKQISDLGYYIQAAHYLNGVREVTGFTPDWLFVTAQKTEPYTVSVHRLHPDALQAAQHRISYALHRWRDATSTNTWPGYTGIYEQNLTAWERIKNEEMENQS